MARHRCVVCEYVYDDEKNSPWSELSETWTCPVCDSPRKFFEALESTPDAPAPEESAEKEQTPEETGVPNLEELIRTGDAVEGYLSDIHLMADTGKSITEPMRTGKPTVSWDDILIKGAQLARLPVNGDVPVNTRTVIGPSAARPLVIETPVLIAHMSFGALSRNAKIALARGSAAVKTAMCSGEGGILSESLESAHRYIFEYVPNEYSFTGENLSRVDAVEIKFGQSAKPGMGGHLPGEKVTPEIAAVRGRKVGESITSPSHFKDIRSKEELRDKVLLLRELSGGRPVGIKFAAGHIEADLDVAIFAEPDFITIDGRAGSTGASPKFIKAATSVPTLFALHRARKHLDRSGAEGISLIMTGGFRVSSDIAKALAMGADAVSLGTSALIALGCQQYRVCNTGKCPMGIATQDPELTRRLDVERAATRIANYLSVTTEELMHFARLTGNKDIHALGLGDLCTANSEISTHTEIEHV